MICEDNPDLLSLFQKALGSKYIIIAVDSGIECLSRYIDEKAKGNRVDVLLIDYQLKDLPGDIVATTIREISGRRRATNTILISTSEIDKEIVEELKRKDCIMEDIEKPISTDSLLNIIKRASINASD
ncbi:MAG: response regulator [Nitrososphaeraceae archaeon]|jgi:CheY-like chemotaxis protein